MKMLTTEIERQLTDLANKAGKDEMRSEFTKDYETLLQLLTATMKAMRALAAAQVAWMEGQSGRDGRMN